MIEGVKVKALIIVTGFAKSQKLTWMNKLIMTLEAEFDPESEKFKITAYEWK
ncbi:MAG: hypothetical protein ACJ707_08310 [Nitrososphaera sp.]